jgi:hypothetical protein
MLCCRGSGGEMTTKSSSKAGAGAGAEAGSSMAATKKEMPGRKKGSGRGMQKEMAMICSSSSRVGVVAGVCGSGGSSLQMLTCRMLR